MLARRIRLAFIDVNAASEALPFVVERMTQLLNWSEERAKQELEVNITLSAIRE